MVDMDSFKFRFSPRFELKSRAVSELDSVRTSLNREYALVNHQIFTDKPYVSTVTVSGVYDTLRDIRSRLKHIPYARLSSFDAVVVDDVVSNVQKVEMLMDDRFTDKEFTMGRLLNGLFGPRAYTLLRDSIRPLSRTNPLGYNHRVMHELASLEDEVDAFLIPVDNILGRAPTARLRKERKVLLDKVEESFARARVLNENFYREAGVVEEFGSYDVDFLLGEASEGWCQPELGVCRTSPEVLRMRRMRDGSLVCDEEYTALVDGHEVSHLLREVASRRAFSLASLREGRRYANHIQGVVNEGVAVASLEESFVRYLSKNRVRLGLSREQVFTTAIRQRAYIHKPKAYSVYNVLREELERKEKNGGSHNFFEADAAKALGKLMGVPYYSYAHNDLSEASIIDVVNGPLVYWFGYTGVRDTLKELKDRGVPDGLVLSALHCGYWSDPVTQRRFIKDVYLPAASDGKWG